MMTLRQASLGLLAPALWVGLVVCQSMARAQSAPGTVVTWKSAATGAEIQGKVLAPAPVATPRQAPAAGNADSAGLPTVIYLTNLTLPRVGQESDSEILADLSKAGMQVVLLDYAKHPTALSPALNADIHKLRQDITAKRFLGQQRVDMARLYVLPEGCRLMRDVAFYKEGSATGGEGHTWAMDIFYPSRPAKAVAGARVPMLMEITCDNANRMGAGSLVTCQDTLVEGALLAGFAAAMVDHPVYPAYKGMFPMPDSLVKMKAAVRTLRAEGQKLGLSEKIGVIGFSRGSPLAALLAVTGGMKEFEAGGLNPGVSSRVQAALVHGERYDFMALTESDSMYQRFEAAWGTRKDKPQAWDAHSTTKYLGNDTPPMFLNTSNAEQPLYREQLELLDKRLTEKGLEHIYQVDADGRGHKVSIDPKTLGAIYGFFSKHLGEK